MSKSNLEYNESIDAPERARQPPIDPPKIFSKVSLLQSLGLLNRKFNFETMMFERSLTLDLILCVTLISKPVFAFKPLISYFFPRSDNVQLFVGK